MRIFRVGIEVNGRQAYCYSLLSFLCSFDVDRALMMDANEAQKAVNWIGFMIPNAKTFIEQVLSDEEKALGSMPKDCPACDSGHCPKH